MKNKLLILLAIMASRGLTAQAIFCDFDTIKKVYFSEWGMAKLDTMHATPDTNAVNHSARCGMYIRDTVAYDNFKMITYGKFGDISSYAGLTASKKMKMKVYTTAPVGTKIQLQLGNSHYKTYPEGVHSEYQGVTTARNMWHEVTFNFLQIPANAFPNGSDLDKMVVLFNPQGTKRDTLYFDDINGPETTPVGLPHYHFTDASVIALPNPAADKTTLRITLKESATLGIRITDMLGKSVLSPVAGNFAAGVENVEINTSSLPEGVYFCTVQCGAETVSRKLIISRQ